MSDPFYQTSEWRALRYKALKRDGWKCVICTASVRAKGTSRVDHIVARKARPDLQLLLTNVRTLCCACDNKRHSEKGGHQIERPVIALDGLPAAWRTVYR